MTAEILHKGPVIGIRHLQAALLFLGVTVNFIARNSISVAVVAMTNADSANPDFPEYDWTEAQRSYILSSFFWGYVVTQFPAGLLVRRFGSKVVLLLPSLTTTVLSALTPYCVSWGGWEALCVIRIIMGLAQGLIFPAIIVHVAKWSPPKDRNRMGVIAYAGSACGLLLAMALSGLIAESSMGWPGIYYVAAGVCGIWCLLWFIFAADNAPCSRFVSAEERHYIEESMKREDGFHAKNIPVPWRALWTSVPFLALLTVLASQGWTSSTMNQQTPAYIHGVLGLNIKSNALYSALPYLASWITAFLFLFFADVALARKWMTLQVLRKSVNTLASWGPALMLIGLGFLDKDQLGWAVALITLKSALAAGSGIGSIITIMDMSPNHSGIIMGITNAAATVLSLLTPLIVGLIVTDTGSRSQWQIVFTVTGVVFFVGNLVYVIWGSTDLQPWDHVDFLKPKDVEQSRPELTKDALKELEAKSH